MLTEIEKVPPNPNKKNKKYDFDLSDDELFLKCQLESCVEIVGESNPKVQKDALEELSWLVNLKDLIGRQTGDGRPRSRPYQREQFRTATSSITSVSKPLKFLYPHYGTLQNHYENMAPDSHVKRLLADILSVLAMSHENQRKP